MASRLKLLAAATGDMKRAFRALEANKPDAVDESRDSCADHVTTRHMLFLKTGSETDLFEARRRFTLLPLDCGHNGRPKSDCLDLLDKALASVDSLKNDCNLSFAGFESV